MLLPLACCCLLVVLLLFTFSVVVPLLSLAQFETVDRTLSAASQARLTLEAVAYHSPNGRYLYIDPPLPGQGLKVGRYANIKLYTVLPASVHIKTFNYLVRRRRR